MKVGVIGGGFKPPHKGHFELAKKALQQIPDLDKLQIYVGASPSGTKDRPGFPMTQEQAIAIWKVYAKQLPGTVEVLPAAQPIGAAYSAASKNPDNEVYWFLGARDQADMKDIEQRKSHLNKNAEKYPNLHVEVINSTGTEVSGTALRKALDNNDKETAFKMLPDGVDKQAVYDIIMNTPEKKMADAIDEVFANLMYTQEDIEWLNAPMGPLEEITKGTPVTPTAVLPSKERQELQNYTEILRDALPDTLDVEYKGDHIRVSIPYFDKEKDGRKYDGTQDQRLLPEETVGQFEFAPHIASILEYCMEQGMKVLPLPDIKIRHDEENAADLFGKTAYYQPQTQEIVLYVTGRHPKDVLRSFCHELIHHQQNLEGRIPAFNTTNTQEDSTLHQIEQEAHMGGSMLFREWEDTCKKRDLEEGTKYRSIVVDIRKAVNAALNTLLSGGKLKGYNIKTRREPLKKDRELAEKYGMTPLGVMFHNEYQTAYLGSFESKSEKGTPTTVGVSLKFALTDEVKPGKYHIDGEAGSDEGEIDIILAFNPEDGTNMLQAIQSQLTDLIRHETEHLTQSGDQVKPTKWMRADQAKRIEIRQNPEIWYKYYLLPKEVDANIQGLYAKAKYEKKDFQDVVDTYLTDLVGDGIITQGDSKQIYSKWKTRAAQIGGIPELR
jgi:hypothetical protein